MGTMRKQQLIGTNMGNTSLYYYKDVTERICCPTCNGNKKVKAKVESSNNVPLECELQCPTCKGYGTILGEKKYGIVKAKVVEINARIRKAHNGSIQIKWRDSDFELVTSVWVETEKGDSRHISGNDLYKTKEECAEAIKTLKKD